MTHFFNGQIIQDNIVNLIIALDADEAQDVDLYFSSTGGELDVAEVLIDYLSNTVKDITLIGHWGIESAALDIYLRSVCKKRLLPDAYGLVHLADQDVSLMSVSRKDPKEMFLKRDVNSYNTKWLQDRRGFFTKKELYNIKHGKDVYLEHERLEEYVKAFGYELVEQGDN